MCECVLDMCVCRCGRQRQQKTAICLPSQNMSTQTHVTQFQPHTEEISSSYISMFTITLIAIVDPFKFINVTFLFTVSIRQCTTR